MSDPLRYILIGAGGDGGAWCRQILPRLRDLNKAIPAAAVDTNPAKLALAQETLGLPPEHCFDDAAEAMQKRRADFAIIAVPTVHQERMIDAALTFDLHILAAGPIAESMEKACRIYRKVRGLHRKRMAVALGRRYDQDVQGLLRVVASRRYGRPHYIVARFAENQRKRGSWGHLRHEMLDVLLIEAAQPHFDVLRGLAGESARSVFAVSWNPYWGEYRGDTVALVTLEMTSGVHCHYEGSKVNAAALNGTGQEYFRVECEHGTIELDRQQLRIISGSGLDHRLKAENLLLPEQPAWGNAWLAEQFCDWIAGGEDPPFVLKDYMFNAATVFAAIQSARTGKIVDVKQYLQEHLEASRVAKPATARPDDE